MKKMDIITARIAHFLGLATKQDLKDLRKDAVEAIRAAHNHTDRLPIEMGYKRVCVDGKVHYVKED